MRNRMVTGALCATVLIGVAPIAAANAATGPLGFDPIDGSAYDDASTAWSEPYVAPDGFTQTLVADETVLDIYPGEDDLTDMNVTNETGQEAGRYLYRTHEVGANGSLSVVDLQTGEAKVIEQQEYYNRLDGLTWTPWGTVLFAEETAGGHVYEAFLDPKDPTVVTRVEERSQLGILRHEGIGAAADGSVYVIDELNGGSIYKFVPTVRGDLGAGQLYALKLTGLTDAEQLWNQATFSQKVGVFEWVALDQAQVAIDADVASNAMTATEFGRPEDVQLIGQRLYVANTSEDRVIEIDLAKQTVSGFVEKGVNVTAEDQAAKVTGFNNPDNLAKGPDGRLWIVEDNDFSDVWVADLDKDSDGRADMVELFASLKDQDAETSGVYFGKDPNTVYLNVQHPGKDLADGTWSISKD